MVHIIVTMKTTVGGITVFGALYRTTTSTRIRGVVGMLDLSSVVYLSQNYVSEIMVFLKWDNSLLLFLEIRWL